MGTPHARCAARVRTELGNRRKPSSFSIASTQRLPYPARGLLPEGVRKLLDIAMAVAGGPQVLLLDEPTSGVSAEEKFRLMDMVMGALQAEGVTVLFVEHDMDIVSRYTHRVLAFYEGRIIADGDPAAVLKDAEVRRYVIGEQIHVAHKETAGVAR